jgi:hypothetical protein
MDKWSVSVGSQEIVNGVSFKEARAALLDALVFRMDTSGSEFDRENYQSASRAYYDLVANQEPASFEDWVGDTHYTLRPAS